jgi:hypothetical protein
VYIARNVLKLQWILRSCPMGKQRPKMSEGEHVVLQFRPRHPARLPDRRPPAAPADPVRDLLPRNQPPDEQPDDFRHRMLANAAAFAFTIALTAVGLWLAMSIAAWRLLETLP